MSYFKIELYDDDGQPLEQAAKIGLSPLGEMFEARIGEATTPVCRDDIATVLTHVLKFASSQTKSKEPELKPCPFCGSSDSIFCLYKGLDRFIRCRKCKARGPWGESEEWARVGWNSRRPGQ